MSAPERRSKSVAAILSLVVPGLGQIYMGHAPRGVAKCMRERPSRDKTVPPSP